jgi:hypothetical protein
MTWLRSIPLSVRWTVPLALLGLALTVPVSAPDGTGMQWDEVVLGAVAVSAAHGILRQSRAMSSEAARPWRFLGGAAALFASAQWLAAAFPGPELDGFGPDDVLLFIGATAPVATCGLLARRVSRTRWSALIVDGLVITVALLVVTATLSVPAVDPIGAPDGRRLLILAYGAYGAIMLGAAGAMCTVSTAALRRSATILVVAVGLQSAAAAAEAMAIASPSRSPWRCRRSWSPWPARRACWPSRAPVPLHRWSAGPAWSSCCSACSACPPPSATRCSPVDRTRSGSSWASASSSRSWRYASCSGSARTVGSPRTSSAARRTSAG